MPEPPSPAPTLGHALYNRVPCALRFCALLDPWALRFLVLCGPALCAWKVLSNLIPSSHRPLRSSPPPPSPFPFPSLRAALQALQHASIACSRKLSGGVGGLGGPGGANQGREPRAPQKGLGDPAGTPLLLAPHGCISGHLARKSLTWQGPGTHRIATATRLLSQHQPRPVLP